MQLGISHHSLFSEGVEAQDYEVCMRAVSIYACVMCAWQVGMGYCANLSLYESLCVRMPICAMSNVCRCVGLYAWV